MMKATVYFTKGWGLEKVLVKANNYKELSERVDGFVNKINGKVANVMGYESTYKIETIVYSYPSGKKFVKNF